MWANVNTLREKFGRRTLEFWTFGTFCLVPSQFSGGDWEWRGAGEAWLMKKFCFSSSSSIALSKVHFAVFPLHSHSFLDWGMHNRVLVYSITICVVSSANQLALFGLTMSSLGEAHIKKMRGPLRCKKKYVYFSHANDEHFLPFLAPLLANKFGRRSLVRYICIVRRIVVVVVLLGNGVGRANVKRTVLLLFSFVHCTQWRWANNNNVNCPGQFKSLY